MHPFIRQTHHYMALLLGLFITLHILVHLTALGGSEMHITTLSFVQKIYRNWLIEPLLFLAILAQIYTGLKLVIRKNKQPNKRLWHWVQILSGLYLVIFLLNHTIAVLLTRYAFSLDTNFYWIANTVLIAPFSYFFIPYYFLAIIAVFAHIAAAVHFKTRGQKKQSKWVSILLILGVVIGTVIVATFAGVFYEIELPLKYHDYFDNYLKLFRGSL